MKNTLLKYLISALVGAGLALLVMYGRGLFAAERHETVYGILSDGFFAAGVILTCVGLIIFVSNGGLFDIFAYSAILFFSLFRRNLERKYKDFYEYREAKKGKKRSLAFLLIVGLVYVAVAALFLTLDLTL